MAVHHVKDGIKYESWRFRMESHFKGKNMLGYLTANPVIIGPVANESEEAAAERERNNELRRNTDGMCRDKIVQKLADSHVCYAMGTTTAHELWKKLEDAFWHHSLAAQMNIMMTLLSPATKHHPGEETLEQHLSKIDSLVRALENAGRQVPVVDKIIPGGRICSQTAV